MKKIGIFIVFLSIFFHSCKEKKKPEHLLSQEKMTDLMYELTILNSAKALINSQDSILILQTPTNILKKYGLDSIHFVEQHRYYASEEKIYSEIFDSIHKRIEKDISVLEAMPEDPKDRIKTDKTVNLKLSQAIQTNGFPVINKKQSSK